MASWQQIIGRLALIGLSLCLQAPTQKIALSADGCGGLGFGYLWQKSPFAKQKDATLERFLGALESYRKARGSSRELLFRHAERVYQDKLRIALYHGLQLAPFNGEKMTLRGYWVRDYPLLSLDAKVPEAEIKAFLHSAYDVYHNSPRVQFDAETRARDEAEDFNFFEEYAWIGIHNEQGDIVAGMKLYYSDFRLNLFRFANGYVPGMSHPPSPQERLPLPLDRRSINTKDSLARLAPTRHFVPEHQMLLARLEYENLLRFRNHSPKEFDRRGAPILQDLRQHFGFTNDDPMTIDELEEAFQTLQSGEVSRFFRTHEPAYQSYDPTPYLIFGTWALSRHEDIRQIYFASETPLHARYYKSLLSADDRGPVFVDGKEAEGRLLRADSTATRAGAAKALAKKPDLKDVIEVIPGALP